MESPPPNAGAVLSEMTHGRFGHGDHRRSTIVRIDGAIADMTHGKFGNHGHRSQANAKLAAITHNVIGAHVHRDRMHSFLTAADDRLRRDQLQLDLQEVCDQAQAEERHRKMILTVLRNMNGFVNMCTQIKTHPHDPLAPEITLRAVLTMHFAGRCGSARNRNTVIEQLLADLPTDKDGDMKTIAYDEVIERVVGASWISERPRIPTAEAESPGRPRASPFVVSLAKRIEDMTIAAGDEFIANGGLLTAGEVQSCVAMHFARWAVPFDTATLYPALLPCAVPPVESISMLRDHVLVNAKGAGKTILRLIRSEEWQAHRTRWAARELDAARQNQEALLSVKQRATRSKNSPRVPWPSSLRSKTSPRGAGPTSIADALTGTFSEEDDGAVCSCDGGASYCVQ